jgi:hypothetical protein
MVTYSAAGMLTAMARITLMLGLVLALAGCSAPAVTPGGLPTGVIPPLSTPTPPGGVVTTPGPGATTPWPAGWDVAFCEYFAQLVIVTELAVDIEPTIADGPKRDARGLANELATTPAYARGLADAVGEWHFADEVITSTQGLLDTAEQAGQQYVAFLSDGKKATQRQARQLRAQLGDEIDAANDALGSLQSVGLACPDHDLQLERP